MTRITRYITKVVFRYIPDPLVVAIILTFFTMLLAVVVERSSPVAVIEWWGDGLWSLLAFTMQMTIILLTGYMLAMSPPADRALRAFSAKVANPNVAIFTATIIAGIAMWLNWGFGLVVAGVLSKKLKEGNPSLNYPLLLASTYSTISVYGIGLSGTIPLLIATPGHFMEEQMGVVSLTGTVLSPLLLATSVVVVISIATFNTYLQWSLSRDTAGAADPGQTEMHADGEQHSREVSVESRESISIVQEDRPRDAGSPGQAAPVGDVLQAENSVAQRLNDSRILGLLIGAVGIVYVTMTLVGGGGLDLNVVNMIGLFLGFLLFARPSAYLAALQDGIKTVSGVVIQYPFYAGIMAILVGSGLIVTIAEFVADYSTAESLPFVSFLSGGLVNLLAPSGGGQWAIQGPVMIETAKGIGSSLPGTAIGVAMGDMWTNIIQPFWLIPALAISGLKLRDIMGYLVLNLVLVGVILSASILAWGYLL